MLKPVPTPSPTRPHPHSTPPPVTPGLSKAQADSLSSAPLVPVANASHLAAPRQLFARLPADLAPFAYEIPTWILAPGGTTAAGGTAGGGAAGRSGAAAAGGSGAGRLALLRSLGAADSPSARYLVESLQGLRQSLAGAPLNANELGSVIRLLSYLAGPEAGAAAGAAGAGAGGGAPGAAAAGSHQAGARPGTAATAAAAAGAAGAQRSVADLQFLSQARSSGRLLVPATDGRLVPAVSALYADQPGTRLLGRVGAAAAMSHGMGDSGLTLVHPQVSQAWALFEPGFESWV